MRARAPTPDLKSASTVSICSAIALIGLVAVAAADTVCLKDGRIIDAKSMERDEHGIKVKFKNGEVLIPQSMVQEAVLDADSAGADKNTSIKKRADERKKYVEDLRAHSEWKDRRKEETAHFKFEYTVPPPIFVSFRDKMEAYFTEFAKNWGITQPKDSKLIVCIYADEDTFHQVSGAGHGILGYFKFVKPYDLDIYYDRLDPELAEEVMFHESNHYLQMLLNVEFKMPHFPGESLAEYYGASKWDDKAKRLTTGMICDARLAEVKQSIDAGDMMSLEKLVGTPEMYEHYNWGWSLIHFLMNTPKYAPRFQKFVKTLATGKDMKRERLGADNLTTIDGAEVLRVFSSCLGVKDKDALKALEKEWHEYVKTELKFVTPAGKEKAAYKAMSTYPSRPLKAKRLFEEAIQEGSKNPNTYHRLAGLLAMEDGNFDQAIEYWHKAIELDPLTAKFYSSLGHALMVKGKKEEGQRLVKLARELDPDDPWLEAVDFRDK